MNAISGPAGLAPSPPPMAGPGAMGLFGGLLDRFTEIVGDGPSYATFHFASQQEGARLAESARPAALADLLNRVDGILGHRSELLAGSTGADPVRIRITGSPLLAGGRVGTGILLGFLEGILKALNRKPFEGKVETQGAAPGDAVLSFQGRAT